MARTPEVPGQPAKHNIGVAVNDGMLHWLDAHRGDLSRPAFIRKIIREAARKTK